MPLTQDQQTIFDAVITALRTNSKTIDQLTPQASLADSDYFELNGGRKVSYATMKSMFAALSDADIVNLNQAITNALEQASAAMTAAQAAQTAAESADGKADAAITRTDNNFRLISQLQGNLQIVDWILKSISAGTAAPDSVKAKMRRVNAWSSEEDEREIVLLPGATESAAGAMTAQQVKDLKLAKGLIATKGHAYGLAPLDADKHVPDENIAPKFFDVLMFDSVVDEEVTVTNISSSTLGYGDEGAAIVYSSKLDRFLLKITQAGVLKPTYCNNFRDSERYGTLGIDGVCPVEGKIYIEGERGYPYVWYDLMLFHIDNYAEDLVDALKSTKGRANGIAPLNASGVVPNENISDEARKSLFCDLFNAAAGTAGYAKFTNGVWDCKLNGLTLSYDEAVMILSIYHTGGDHTEDLVHHRVRTNLPLYSNWVINLTRFAQNNTSLEVANVDCVINGGYTTYVFYGCKNLREIRGPIRHQVGKIDNSAFLDCPKLESLDLRTLKSDLRLNNSPLLKLDSLDSIVTNAANGNTAITITVHADVYAKLTGDTTNEAAAALTAEELSQWQALLTKAAGKHIAFASA